MKILICGLPGSGKTTLAESLADKIGAYWINADEIRAKYNDLDFSPEARIRQAYRMKYLADGIVMTGEIAIADFVCPTKETREIFDADYTIWMHTIEKGRFADTNAMFEPLDDEYDYEVLKWDDATPILLSAILREDVMRKSNYIVVHDDEEKLVLHDIGPWDKYVTITNNAENVVEENLERLGDRRLFYYDSELELAELVIKDGVFYGFGWVDLKALRPIKDSITVTRP